MITFPLAHDFESQLARDIILTKNDKDGIKTLEYIKRGLYNNNFNKGQLIITQQLKKDVCDYNKITPLVSAAKKEMLHGHRATKGTRIRYLITRGEGTVSERAEPSYHVELEDIDYEYYLDRLELIRQNVIKSECDYDHYLKTLHWQDLRYRVLQRDGLKCQLCSSTEDLEVHHNTYDNLWNEPLEDLVVLCHRHHELYHTMGGLDVTEESGNHSDRGSCRV